MPSGFIFHHDGEIKEDGYIIKMEWLKRQSISKLLCDFRIAMELKGNFYKMTIRPAMLYGLDWWAIKKLQI